MRRLAAAAAVVLVLSAAACSSDQDPGFEQAPSDGSSTSTPRLIEPCPDGGPNETTPPAGCLDENGRVVRP